MIPTEPVDGIVSFYRYVSKNLEYPQRAKELDVQGRVFIEFVINEEGRPINTLIIRGIGAGCDEEAVRVVKDSPDWKPCVFRGRYIKQKLTFPLNFNIIEDSKPKKKNRRRN